MAKGVDVKIIADLSQSQEKNSQIRLLQSHGISVEVIKGQGRWGIMHNKFAIFDDKEVITGSYNWSENAEKSNLENAIFISDPGVVNKYLKEFDQLYR